MAGIIFSEPPTPGRARWSVWAARLLGWSLAGWCASLAAAVIPSSAPQQLDPVTVTGTRIRSGDADTISPVDVYDRELIGASGALTLADFLRTLPQNYTGIGAGRGSVPDELNPEVGQRTESSVPFFDLALGASAAPPGETGVSAAGLRGLGSGSTLVLVDGRRLPDFGEGNASSDSQQGFVNLNTIPLGMVERIEVVTDGASPIYGSDAVAGVINLVLKRNYTGSEVRGTYRGTWHGGARERQITATTGFARGGLRGVVALEHYDRSALKASQRAFSRNQDHRAVQIGVDAEGRPVFGGDLRLNWGYPAVLQAVSGNLAGVVDAAGHPVPVALVPEGSDGRPLDPAQFLPGVIIPPNTAMFAPGQRRENTAEFLDLVPSSERHGISGSLEFEPTENVVLYGRAMFAQTRGLFATQPAVSAASAYSGFGAVSTVVPAAFNPFGQDVFVGLVHHEFGSITQATRLRAYSGVIGARGRLGETWYWDAAVSAGRNRSERVTRELDAFAVSDALRNPDPARRLNPFVDARVAGPLHAGLYESMALYESGAARSELLAVDAMAEGTLFALNGRDVAAAFGAEWQAHHNRRASSSSDGAATATQSGRARAHALFAELRIPLAGRRGDETPVPLLHKFDLQVAARYEDHGDAGTKTVPKLGFVWRPHRALLLRGSRAEGFRAPDLTEGQIEIPSSDRTVTDPRRTPGVTSDVTTRFGSFPGLRPETSVNEFIGATFEPPFAHGLALQVNYYSTRQRDAIQRLGPQTLVNYEALFPGRVTRAEPTADDLARGQPGRITAIDATLVNFGSVHNESIDYVLDYRLPSDAIGRVNVSFHASRTLVATFEASPGEAARDDLGDTFSPPRWKFAGSVSWSRAGWAAVAFVSHIGAFESNHAGNLIAASEHYRAHTVVDLRGSYTFERGIRGRFGKGVVLGVGIGNVFDREPPFSDTVFGFNGGLYSPLGRTYEMSLTVPF